MKAGKESPETLRDKESEEMQKQLEEREAGVAELFDFYSKIEAVYVSTLRALEEGQAVKASATTNYR